MTSSCWRERILAGYGFRTARAAHDEVAALTGREVISLELVDPHLYHLDVALAVLDDERDHLAYYPPAFSPASRRVLAECFPDAIIATERDAYAFGLNCVSDGHNVFLPAGAAELRAAIAAAGYRPVSIDLSELAKGGGSVKCCTQEIRTKERRRATMTVLDDTATRTGELLAREAGRVAHNYHPLEVVVATGSGAVLTDVDGTEYLDFLAAYSATNFGHRHPALLAAARAAAGPGHADLAGVPPRPVGRLRRRSGPSWSARTWCCR